MWNHDIFTYDNKSYQLHQEKMLLEKILLSSNIYVHVICKFSIQLIYKDFL